MRILAACIACAAIAPAQAAAATTPTLVVDDDRRQCAKADFTSVQGAVDAAEPGSTIRVCPGRYRGPVTIDKPLRLKGDPEAVAAIDCFDPLLGATDPAVLPIVDGAGSAELATLSLAADDVTVQGFAFEGAVSDPLPADTRLYRRAIDTTDAFSGYRAHHNLFSGDTVAIELGSGGARESRFDHNCLRLNRFGLSNGDRALVVASIDHNLTYRTTANAFEPAAGRVERVRFEHNRSRQDNTAYLIRNSSAATISANTIESARLGVVVGGGAPNVGLEIAGNLIAVDPLLPVTTQGGVQQGIAFAAPPLGVEPNSDVSVAGNTIMGMRDGIVAAGPPNTPRASLAASAITLNTVSASLRDGIVLRGLNSGNVVSANAVTGNAEHGIYAQGATGNRFLANTMLGNGVFDAVDLDRPANEWAGNVCVVDDPAGTICGPG